MKTTFQRTYLDKLLVQDFGCTWDAAHVAVNRYYGEAYGSPPPPWWALLVGDPYAITEWIWGTKHYWREQRRATI